jgi:single-stranded-DNA-specific exonuclease
MAENRFTGISGKPIVIDEALADALGSADVLTQVSPQARSIILNNLKAHRIDPSEWKQVLGSTSEIVPPPFALKGSKEGAEHFIDALHTLSPSQKIAIWGDYDADGNTASTVLGTLARQLRPDGMENIEHYIPRREEGYGLNIPGIAKLADKGVKSLFVVDTGTVAYEPIAYARSRGMDVVVLDHHQPRPDEALPEGAIIINPHRRDETATRLRDLSAAGISWLFARDVEEAYRQRGETKTADAIDHGLITVAASLGTVADVVSLQSPINRYIIEQGLQEMQTGRYPGIEAMKGLFGIRNVRESDIAFAIGPSINASGRLDDPTVGMRMLLATSQAEAEKLAKELTAYNDERKQFSNRIIFRNAEDKATQFMQAHPSSPLLMVEDSHWMGGVVGIVASRLKEHYGLPALVGHAWKGKDNHDYITYSARSIEQVDLFRSLSAAFKTLPEGDVVKFGGHAMAAGLTIRADAKERVLSVMQEALNTPVRKALAQDAMHVAAEITPEDLTVDTVRSFYQFGPYGARIAPPRLLLRNVQSKHVREMGDDGEHLQVALGAPDSSAPYDGLRYGTAFRAKGSLLGELLQDANRHNQAFDVVIEPYVFEKKNGEAAVGYHLIDASPARVVGQSPDPQDILNAHVQRLVEFRSQREAEIARIQSLPLKTEDLVKGKSAESQAILKQMYDAHISLLDTETTGLHASHPDHEKTNGLTQIAAGKVVKVGKNGDARYALETKVYVILPVTPAYYAYAARVKESLRNKVEPPPYVMAQNEYVIEQGALNVTGTEFKRASDGGPIKSMIVNGEKVAARPLYEVAGDIAEFLHGTVPHAYNMPFDARVMIKQFSDVLAAREYSPDAPAHLQIADDATRENYRKLTEPLHTLVGADQITPDTPSCFAHMAAPANYCCVLHAALMDKGEKAANKLDDMALRYDVSFLRDPSKHDAHEDISPLFFLISEQLKHFGEKEYGYIVSPDLPTKYPDISNDIRRRLQTKPYTLRDEWELLARSGDPGAKATPCDVIIDDGKKKKKKKGTEEEEIKTAPGLRLSFPAAASGEDLPGVGGYLATLGTAKKRNSRIPALILEATDDSITLNADAKMGSSDIPLFGAFKKSLCVDRLLQSRLASRVKAFDSTGLVDVTLVAPAGTTPVVVEDVPLGSLRKSLDFLLDPAARPHVKEYLELIRWVNDLPESGLATLDASGIMIRGLQRDFGDIRMMLPAGKTMAEAIPEIRANTRQLLSLGSVPGALKTEYVIAEDELDDGREKEHSGMRLATHYRLDAPHRVLMEVSTPLLSLVAQEKAYALSGDHFVWPGGIVGQKAESGDYYLMHGALEAFEEAGQQIRNAAWLLYRFNQLPGIKARKTVLADSGTLTLQCEDKLPVETAWILHRAHVPFKATADTLEISMPALMHDAFHWYWEIRKDQEFVKNEMEKKKPEKPPVFLQAVCERLHAGAISNLQVNRTGELFVTLGSYPLVPVDRSITQEALARQDPAKVAIDSPLFTTPSQGAPPNTGLAVRLAQMHGVHENYSALEKLREHEYAITPPVFDALATRDMLVDEFRGISRLARSTHINPFLDTLRGIVNSDAMRPDHNEPVRGESPLTRVRIDTLNTALQAIMPHMEPITKDIEAFQANFGEVRLKEEIFRNVAQLHLIQETLAEAHTKKQLPGVTEQEYQQMQLALKDYYESLSMAEFKRYRLTLDGLQVIKSIERLSKAASKQQEKLDSESPYSPYQAHKELAGAIEKLWEDGKRYKRTLDFSDEIIACSASLRDWRKTERVEKAIALTHTFQQQNIETILSKLKTEGGAPECERQGEHWRINTSILEQNPDYWNARLGELQKVMQSVPPVPHMVIDTSSMLTLLLGNESVPGDRQAGYLGIIQDLAQHGAITPVLTGAVLAEFLNSPIPLTPKDIFVLSSDGKAVGIRYTDENRRHVRFKHGSKSEIEYPKWHQRMKFLMELYNSGQAKFIETPTERQYCDAIRAHAELDKSFGHILNDFPDQVYAFHGKQSLAEVTNDELKDFLLHPSQARTQFMNQMRAAGVRKDIGEVSMADAIKHIHDTYGPQTPVYVLYEGNDVRGRIVQRLALGDGAYMAGKGKQSRLQPQFNPNHSKFNPDNVAALQNTHFLSTLGFLAGVMKRAKEHGAFIASPDEHHFGIPADIDNPPHNSYPGIGKVIRKNAGEALNGGERVYNKMVDEPASELGKSPKHSSAFTGGVPGPWQQHVEQLDTEIIHNALVRHMLRSREYYESTRQHYGKRHRAAQERITLINDYLKKLEPKIVTDNTAVLAPLSAARLFAEEPAIPLTIEASSSSHPRAVELARLVLAEHTKTLAMRDGAEEPRLKLPITMRFKVQAIPKKERAQVVAEAGDIVRNSLKATPQDMAYAETYKALLEATLENPKRTRGAS